MGGLKHLLFRLIPIITLICFICLGITYTFQQTGQNNITYLEEHYYDKSNNFIEIINPTTEQKESANTYKTYEFDFESYRQNIDQDILKRSLENIIDIEAFDSTRIQFETIWKDDYQFGDISKTIANAIILIVNAIILPINIIITPLRIISGILLTTFSLIGININNETLIVTLLTTILDSAAIPMINVLVDKITTGQYTMYSNMNNCYKSTYVQGILQYYEGFEITVRFNSQGGGQYTKIITTKEATYNYSLVSLPKESRVKIWYEDTNNNQILVYDNQWLYENSKQITIISYDTSNETLKQNLEYYLNAYATKN